MNQLKSQLGTKCNFHISLSPARVHKKFIQKLKAIDYNTDFGDLLNKVDKLQVLIKKARKDPDLTKYVTDLIKIGYQGLIYNLTIYQLD